MKIYNKVVIEISTGRILEEDSFEWDGDVALMKGGGGGGSSGTVGFPDYIEEVQADLLGGGQPDGTGMTTVSSNLVQLMNTALAGTTPYENADAYDPTSYLSSMATAWSEFDTVVKAVSAETTQWQTYLSTVVTKADDGATFPSVDILDALSTAVSDALSAASTALSSTVISDQVTQFENEKKPGFLRGLSNWTAQMADIGAENTTNFAVGMALAQSDFERQVDSYRKELKLSVWRDIVEPSIKAHLEAALKRAGFRDAFIATSIASIMQLLNTRLQGYRDASSLKNEVDKLAIIAKKEQNDFDIELDAKHATWDLELFQYASGLLASAGGGVPGAGTTPVTPAQSALSGAMSGASIGAAFGPWGAGVGAVLGGAAGFFAS